MNEVGLQGLGIKGGLGWNNISMMPSSIFYNFAATLLAKVVQFDIHKRTCTNIYQNF